LILFDVSKIYSFQIDKLDISIGYPKFSLLNLELINIIKISNLYYDGEIDF